MTAVRLLTAVSILCASAAGAVSVESPLPFSFNYGGRDYRGIVGPIDETLTVSVEHETFSDFLGADWYTVWFRNDGDSPSRVLKNIRAIDLVLLGEKPVLRGILGDHGGRYAPYEQDLSAGPKEFASREGRATHGAFPYFDLVHGDGGTLLALGWAGTWSCAVSSVPGGARFCGESCLGFEAQLRPGERIRTALVARVPYRGRAADAAGNLWRRWFVRHVLPKNADGSDLKPFTTACFAADTGLPNSDGSISERATTWKPTLDKLVAERVAPDFRWFDAGWYSDPAGNTVEKLWWQTVGSWELDRVKWPGMSFRESNEACHAAGLKTLVWFEPERVTDVASLVTNFGYKSEWAIQSTRNKDVITSDLGNPDCLKWTLGRIVKMMDENAVDMYREDNNSDPADAWKTLDARSEKATGLVRRGISENFGIQGHYALWDGIIGYCRGKGKCTFVDSCASGGGRNDLESMRRAIPLLRSDADRTTSALRLSMTSTFPKWIPFQGSATKETKWELEASAGAGSDEYVFRASFLPVCNNGEAFTHNPDLDYGLLRRNLAEWRAIAPLLVKDFYVLTPWHSENDRAGWTAFAYHDPETGRAALLAFRQEECATDELVVKLPFVADSAQRTRTVRLDRPRTSHLEFFSAAR